MIVTKKWNYSYHKQENPLRFPFGQHWVNLQKRVLRVNKLDNLFSFWFWHLESSKQKIGVSDISNLTTLTSTHIQIYVYLLIGYILLSLLNLLGPEDFDFFKFHSWKRAVKAMIIANLMEMSYVKYFFYILRVSYWNFGCKYGILVKIHHFPEFKASSSGS